MEQAQVARFEREIRALGKAASWDAESLAQAVQLQTLMDATVTAAARDLNAQGFSWAEIGAALNMTRTGAHKRYAART